MYIEKCLLLSAIYVYEDFWALRKRSVCLTELDSFLMNLILKTIPRQGTYSDVSIPLIPELISLFFDNQRREITIGDFFFVWKKLKHNTEKKNHNRSLDIIHSVKVDKIYDGR